MFSKLIQILFLSVGATKFLKLSRERQGGPHPFLQTIPIFSRLHLAKQAVNAATVCGTLLKQPRKSTANMSGGGATSQMVGSTTVHAEKWLRFKVLKYKVRHSGECWRLRPCVHLVHFANPMTSVLQICVERVGRTRALPRVSLRMPSLSLPEY